MRYAKPKLLFLPLALLLMLACAIPAPSNGNNTQATQALLLTQLAPVATTQVPTSTVLVVPATITLTATSTLIPTITLTATPAIPMVSVSVGTNCREGPGRIYNRVDGLLVGEQAEIVSLAPAGLNYVVIRRPHEPGECWLWLEYATVSGDASRLPIAVIPPTPTLIMTATPTSTSTSTPTLAPPTPFGGSWNMIVFGNPYVATLIQTGSSITGTFTTSGGKKVDLAGTVGPDGKTATGTFTETSGVNGTFVWYLLNNMAQFNGHGDIAGSTSSQEWCGYRAGQSAPVPCLAP
jgi:hypothetical protein